MDYLPTEFWVNRKNEMTLTYSYAIIKVMHVDYTGCNYFVIKMNEFFSNLLFIQGSFLICNIYWFSYKYLLTNLHLDTLN